MDKKREIWDKANELKDLMVNSKELKPNVYNGTMHIKTNPATFQYRYFMQALECELFGHTDTYKMCGQCKRCGARRG
jgi:hypothetical protein